MYTLENACKVQVDVLASHVEMIFPDQEVLSELSRYNAPPADAPSTSVTRSWDAIIRLLDQQDPSYRA